LVPLNAIQVGSFARAVLYHPKTSSSSLTAKYIHFMTFHTSLQLIVLVTIIAGSISVHIRVPVVAWNEKQTTQKSLNVDAGNAGIFGNVRRNVIRLIDGTKGLWPNFIQFQKIKKFRKINGDKAITFTQFKFLEQTKEDLSKLFRLAITFPISPEFFFYSYIAFPLISSGNPWAWQSLPSGYDDVNDKIIREKALIKRRIQAVINGISVLKSETLDDILGKKKDEKLEQIEIIEDALMAKSVDDAIDILSPWLLTENKRKLSSLTLNLSLFPGSIIKDCCRSVGIDGVPNIPLIRRMNVGELSKYIDKIRESDEFLIEKSMNDLNTDELKKACFERCIRTENRNDKDLRSDLQKWLAIACAPGSVNNGPRNRKLSINEQNRRFALMALHTAADFQSNFAKTYRLLCN